MRKLPPNDDVVEMIQTIDSEGEGLTSFEIDFIASFIDNPPRRFTVKQIELIERIHKQRVKE